MRKLNPSEHSYAEFARQVHRVSPAEGTKISELMEPAYWSHIAGKLHQYDIIEVIPQGGEFFAEFVVVNCSKVHAKVALLSKVTLGKAEAPKKEEDGGDELFDIQFKGPQRKWSILRKADKAIVKEEFASKDEAAAWLAGNRTNLLA
jgi:hypothetical protein